MPTLMMTGAARQLPPLAPSADRPHAGPYIRFNGREVFRGKGFLRGQRITCPNNHKLDFRTKLMEDGVLYCDSRADKGAAPCGALVYVLVFPARGHAKQRMYLADCTREEVELIQRAGLDPDGILEYFGATFPR